MADKLPHIEVGYAVFLADGADAFGAVRDIVPDGKPVLLVNIEGAGDVRVPIDAIVKVAAKKVIVRWDRLDEEIHEAIRHTVDVEDFPPAGGEVELEPASLESEDEDDRRMVAEPRVDSPRDELPGRDEGSSYFLPHHGATSRRGGK